MVSMGCCEHRIVNGTMGIYAGPGGMDQVRGFIRSHNPPPWKYSANAGAEECRHVQLRTGTGFTGLRDYCHLRIGCRAVAPLCLEHVPWRGRAAIFPDLTRAIGM